MRRRGLPIYLQIKEMLLHRMESGQLRPGDRLPSEREISETYGISRMTVRQAVLDLVQEGYLERHQGKGTFVCLPKLSQSLTTLTGYTEDMLRRGLKPSARILQKTSQLVPPHVAKGLGLELQETVFVLRRLRLADDLPMAIETSYLSSRVLPTFVFPDQNDFSLYRYLQSHFGIHLAKAVQTVQATLAGVQDGNLLGVSPGAPLLATERITYLANGDALEHAVSVYRADRYKFYTELIEAPTLLVVQEK